jgi:uncharacterized protein (DUF305 family)
VIKDAWRFSALWILIPAVTLAAWRQESHSRSRNTAADPQWSEFVEDMRKMHSAMISVQPSADGDVDFVLLMLPHHQAAINMAKSQLMYGKDPQVRRLAQEIITDQQSEIELMQLWLKRHEPRSPEANQAPASSVSKEQ